jgi:stage II sporulation protein P
MRRLLLFLMIAMLALPLAPAWADDDGMMEEFFDALNLDTRDDGGVYTLYDQEGNVLMRTARHIHVGDTWIGRDNNKWEVYQVEKDDAYANLVRPARDQSLLQRFQAFLTGIFPRTRDVQEEGNVENRIGVYNTHGAEAYLPNDGVESDPDGGGIIKVAESLAAALEEQGVEVVQSKETHVPHDAGAYKRSRNTVEEILGQGVDATIDVHRDAIAAEEYLEDGMVQIQLVVGRQNQNQATVQQFAEELKAIADEKYPGLIKGIFSAKGNYNQDMTPTSILIEVGTHENDREGAQESVALFADVLTTYLYGTSEGQQLVQEGQMGGNTILRTILWMLALLVVGGGIFLYVSAGSWPEMKRKLKGFTKGEFGDLFKGRLKNRGDDNLE